MYILKRLFSNQIVILAVIVFVGFYLRVFRLSEIPVGFHIDEAQVGYNAYSILKTVRDETGKFLSTHLTLWGVDRPLAISYLTIPGIIVFGLTEFGTRIDTAIVGVFSIILVFLLTKEIFNNKSLSIITTFLFAISPWHIVLSRATSEAVDSLAFYILGSFFCWCALKKNSLFLVFLGYISFVLSFFFYHSTRITIPFIFIFFTILAWKEKRRIACAFLGFTLIYIIFPLLPFWGTSFDRFKLVSVFNAPETKLLLEEQIREDGIVNPLIITRLFHNKIINFSIKLTNNFLYYFTYDFLIFKGGFPFRYIVPNMGVIYFIELPLFIWGVISVISGFFKQRRSILIFILLWIILGVFSATLTVEESPNVNRALFILPALQWLIGIGLLDLARRIKSFSKVKYLFWGIFGLVFFWNIFYFVHQYTVHSFTHRPWYRFYEMKEVVSFLAEAEKQYKNTVLTFNSTEPYIFFLFYNKTNPSLFQELIKNKGLSYVWNNIENIKITRRDCPIIPKEERSYTLAVYKVQCYFPVGARVLKKFKYSDGETSLVAVDFPKNYTFEDKDLKYVDETKIEQNSTETNL